MRCRRRHPDGRAVLAAGVALIALAGCSDPGIPVTLEFDVAFNGRPIHCSSTDPALSDARFFLSEPSVLMSDGRELSLSFEPVQDWSTETVAMIDLEDGSGSCRNGTAATRHTAIVRWPPGEVATLSMTVGVPFELNHADPLSAAPPLDDAAMHWHWRGGYKFLRAGVERDDGGFWLHLGSTGCEGRIGNITSCGAPNRIAVPLADFVAGRSVVTLHMDRLFDGARYGRGEDASCSSGPLEAGCEAVFTNLGLRDADPSPWLTVEHR